MRTLSPFSLIRLKDTYSIRKKSRLPVSFIDNYLSCGVFNDEYNSLVQGLDGEL